MANNIRTGEFLPPPPEQCYLASSHKDAVDQVITHLENYYPSLTTSCGSKNLLLAHRLVHGKDYAKDMDNFNFGRGKQKIFCKNCMHNEHIKDNPLHLCVVAVVDCVVKEVPEQDDEEEPTSRAYARVSSLYPHGHTCNESFTSRREIQMCPEHGGHGHRLIYNFPQDIIFGETYDKLASSIKNLDVADEGNWRRIINAAKVGVTEYPFDKRFQANLNGTASKQEKDLLGLSDEFQKEHDTAMERLLFWWGNKTNCWMEIYGNVFYPNNCGTPHCIPQQSFPNDENAMKAVKPYNFFTFPNPKTGTHSDNVEHLSIKMESCLWGGHQMERCNDPDGIIQTPHGDIGEVNGITLANNQKLAGKMKPSSLIFSLDKDTSISRDVLVHENLVVTKKISVRYGSMLWLQGDTTHSGAVYPKNEEPRLWRPSLHAFLVSRHHHTKALYDTFEVDAVAIANVSPAHLSHLPADKQLEAVIPHVNKMLVVFKEGMQNSNHNRRDLKTIKSFMENTAENIYKVLQVDIEDEAGKVGRKNPKDGLGNEMSKSKKKKRNAD